MKLIANINQKTWFNIITGVLLSNFCLYSMLKAEFYFTAAPLITNKVEGGEWGQITHLKWCTRQINNLINQGKYNIRNPLLHISLNIITNPNSSMQSDITNKIGEVNSTNYLQKINLKDFVVFGNPGNLKAYIVALLDDVSEKALKSEASKLYPNRVNDKMHITLVELTKKDNQPFNQQDIAEINAVLNTFKASQSVKVASALSNNYYIGKRGLYGKYNYLKDKVAESIQQYPTHQGNFQQSTFQQPAQATQNYQSSMQQPYMPQASPYPVQYPACLQQSSFTGWQSGQYNVPSSTTATSAYPVQHNVQQQQPQENYNYEADPMLDIYYADDMLNHFNKFIEHLKQEAERREPIFKTEIISQIKGFQDNFNSAYTKYWEAKTLQEKLAIIPRLDKIYKQVDSYVKQVFK